MREEKLGCQHGGVGGRGGPGAGRLSQPENVSHGVFFLGLT